MTFEQIKEIYLKEKSMTSGFKTSGILIEDWIEKQFSFFIRMPAKSEYDFTVYGRPLDVKACSASLYGNNIFIEGIQNVKTGSFPSYIKNKDIMLLYIDMTNGALFIIDFRKLAPKLEIDKMVKGGYNAMGWKINLDEYPDAIRRIK